MSAPDPLPPDPGTLPEPEPAPSGTKRAVTLALVLFLFAVVPIILLLLVPLGAVYFAAPELVGGAVILVFVGATVLFILYARTSKRRV